MWWRRRQARADGGKNETGAAAETLAAAHLVAHGARILARNVRCRGGEVDIIARIGPTVVFVEVRLRHREDFGGASASITAAKQRRVALAAQYWLCGSGRAFAHAPCRFDVVLLSHLDTASIEWIQGAFDASR